MKDIRSLNIVHNTPGAFLKATAGVRSKTTGDKKSNPAPKHETNSVAQPVNEDFLDQICKQGAKKMKRPDGRPSTGTMEREWEFMKSHFINNAGDELEWLMVSKKKGACAYARRKSQEAEDMYFKSLYEVESTETKAKIASSQDCNLIPIITEIASLHKMFVANPYDATATAKFSVLQAELRAKISQKNVLGYNGFTVYSPFSEKTISMLNLLLDDSIEKPKAVKKARDLHTILPGEISKLQGKLSQARLDGDESLGNIEKWTRREKESKDYAQVVKQEEHDWLEKEFEDNAEALRVMRSLIPTNIATLSVQEIMDLVKIQPEAPGYYPFELASELKNNKLLHWVVTHKDDISMSNFLLGEKKQFFENIEALDLTEIRALVICLPDKFELDPDGKKMEWRQRLFARAKMLVSQSRGECVKGAWDDSIKARVMVSRFLHFYYTFIFIALSFYQLTLWYFL